MVSPVEGRSAYDIRATMINNPDLLPKILQGHALTGCHTVPATYDIGKATSLKVTKKHGFSKLGCIQSSEQDIVEECKNFMVLCH